MPVLRGSRSGSEGGGGLVDRLHVSGGGRGRVQGTAPQGQQQHGRRRGGFFFFFFCGLGAGSSLGERKVQSSRGKAGAERYGPGVGGGTLFGCRKTRERQRKEKKKRPNNGAERVRV